MTKRTELGLAIEEGLKEAVAHRRGQIALETRIVQPIPADRVKAIRKSVARTTKEFETKTGIPHRTVEGWEQGRRIDPAARALLRAIEKDPEAVLRALETAS